jgi:hypothetical protein
MHVDAVLVLRVGIFEIVGESKRRRKFLSGRWIKVRIGAAGVDCVMPNAEIHDPVGIVGPHSQVSRDVGHEVVNARIPAHIELRDQIGEAAHRFTKAARSRKTDRSQRTGQGCIDGRLAASKRHQQQYGCLSTQEWGSEHIARDGETEVRSGIQICSHIPREIRGDVPRLTWRAKATLPPADTDV